MDTGFQIINNSKNAKHNNWLVELVRVAINKANIVCKEVVIYSFKNSKNIYLYIDGEDYRINIWEMYSLRVNHAQEPTTAYIHCFLRHIITERQKRKAITLVEISCNIAINGMPNKERQRRLNEKVIYTVLKERCMAYDPDTLEIGIRQDGHLVFSFVDFIGKERLYSLTWDYTEDDEFEDERGFIRIPIHFELYQVDAIDENGMMLLKEIAKGSEFIDLDMSSDDCYL